MYCPKYGKEGDNFRKRVAWQHVRVTYKGDEQDGEGKWSEWRDR